MKTCRKCFDYCYVSIGGDVRICPWNGIVIGNLLNNTLKEIWHGEQVKIVREAFKRGELLGCNEAVCPDCINDWDSIHIDEAEMERMEKNLSDAPEYLSLAYDERCNHACPSCRKDIMKVDKKYIEDVMRITSNIKPYINGVKQLITNGIGELFVTTEIVDLLQDIKPEREDFSLFLETNGVLFQDNWHKIEHLSKYPITVSVTPNSFDRETYKYLAGVDDLRRFEESMQFLTDLKHQGKISRIRLIMVVQDSNFRQIPDFVRRGLEYDADDIVLRSLFFWFGLEEDLWLYKNVLNPFHPYHQEYLEVIQDPICKHPRVLNWGYDVIQEPVEFPTLAMKRELETIHTFNKAIDRCVEDILPTLRSKVGGGAIILYGVGMVGKYVLEKIACGNEALPIRGFMVECGECNPKYWMGNPVKEINAYLDTKDTDVVLVALTRANQAGVKETLQKAGYQKIVMIDERSDVCL